MNMFIKILGRTGKMLLVRVEDIESIYASQEEAITIIQLRNGDLYYCAESVEDIAQRLP